MKIVWYGLIVALGVGITIAGAAYAGLIRLPTDFYVGQTHNNDGDTAAAPQRTGG